MVPGVSRSGATIVGAMLMGVEKRAAAEFSFFLAIPTMAGAFVLDAWKNRHELANGHIELVAIGFVVSFIVALRGDPRHAGDRHPPRLRPLRLAADR